MMLLSFHLFNLRWLFKGLIIEKLIFVVFIINFQLYIILIRPERNVRQSMMPVRYSTVNKNPTTPAQCQSSMITAVVVTAATSNQKDRLQKHLYATEDKANGIQGKNFFLFIPNFHHNLHRILSLSWTNTQ